MFGNEKCVTSVSSNIPSSHPASTSLFSPCVPSAKNIFPSNASVTKESCFNMDVPKIPVTHCFPQSSSLPPIFPSQSWFGKTQEQTPAFTKSFILFTSSSSPSSLFKNKNLEISAPSFQNEFRWTSNVTSVCTTTITSSGFSAMVPDTSVVSSFQQSSTAPQGLFSDSHLLEPVKANTFSSSGVNVSSSTVGEDIGKGENNITNTFAKKQCAQTFSFVKAYKEASENVFQKHSSDIEESKESQPIIQQRPLLKTVLKEGLFGKALAGVHLVKHDDLENQNAVAFNLHSSNLDQTTKPERCMISSEELQKITSIVCKNVPEVLNHRNIIRNHFSKFGAVKRVNCNALKGHCIVHFIDHQDAQNAKKHGSKISEDHPPVSIFWTQTSSQKSVKNQDRSIGKDSSSPKGGYDSMQVELDEELRAMREGAEDRGVLQRPDVQKSRSKEVRSSKEIKSIREGRSSKEVKSPKDAKNYREVKSPKAVKLSKEVKSPKETNSSKEISGCKETKSSKEASGCKETKSSKEEKSPKDLKSSKEIKSSKEGKSSTETNIVKEARISTKEKNSSESKRVKEERVLKESKHLNELKSTKDKKESVKSKKITESSNGKLPTPDNTEESLLAIMESMAQSEEDKYRILNARDRLMRLRQRKNSDLSKATAIVGTCPDMCPEKERYSRHIKNNLSIFEFKNVSAGKLNNEVDHKAVVKEYSRPSADQEEPLPHELRPPHVLEFTINHLLCNTMDNMDDLTISAGEWYDFIWNRTRAIRKDITQQHLCDIACVEMVEKCARFHIHCAAVLCEKDMATFDPKINNENLTKCLQTLKHLYHDLGEKGVKCSHEEEFRAYDILLNLNKGDILREVQQLSEDIQKSQIVKFAVQTFSALNSNNYVRFFRLVQEAPYLLACLMHGYFPQVRIRALQTILKAYSRHSLSQQYPIQELVRILAFESTSEAQFFCQWLGLKVNDNYVVLDRLAFSKPLSSPVISRAQKLVESKRITSVGEVVNGCPLPPNPYITYVPHNSFNYDGYLKKEAYYALDQAEIVKLRNKDLVVPPATMLTIPKDVQQPAKLQEQAFEKFISGPLAINKEMVAVSPITSAEMVIEPNLSKHPSCPKYNDEVMKEVGHEIIADVIIPEVKDTCKQMILNATISELLNDCILFDVNEILRNMCEEVMQEENLCLENTRQAIWKAEKWATAILSRELILDVICELSDSIARDVHGHALFDWVNQMSSAAWRSTLECLSEEVVAVASEVYAEEKAILNESVKEVKEKILMKRVRRMFLRWQNVCNQRQRLNSTRRTFPCGPPSYGSSSLSKLGLNVQSPFEVDFQQNKTSKLLEAGAYFNLLREEVLWYPLNIADIAKQALQHSWEQRHGQKLLGWKLVMFLPLAENNSNYLHLFEWLAAKFSKGYVGEQNNALVKTCSLYHTEIEDSDCEIAVCVKTALMPHSSPNLLDICKEETLLGTSALLVVLPSMSQDQLFIDYVYHLKELLQKKTIYPPPPLYLFLVGSLCDSSFFRQNHLAVSELDMLKTKGLISDYKISLLEANISHPSSTQKLQESVEWLMKHKPQEPDLIVSYLKDYLEDGLMKFVFNLIYDDLSERYSHGIYHQSPSAIISLHNAAINHLASVASSYSLCLLSWPVPEFVDLVKTEDKLPLYWNTEDNLQKLKNIILGFHLPSFETSLQDVSSEDDVWCYVQSFAEEIGQNATDLFSSVDSLILRGQRATQKTQQQIIPWSDIISSCARHALTCSDFTDENGKEYMVHYFQDDFDNFQLPKEWVMAAREASQQNTKKQSLIKRSHSFDKQEEPLNKRSSWPFATHFSHQSPTLSAAKHQSQKLMEAISDETEASKSFTSLLEIAIDKTDYEPEITQPSHVVYNQAVFIEPKDNSTEYSHLTNSESITTRLKLLQSHLNSQRKASELFTESLHVLLE